MAAMVRGGHGRPCRARDRLMAAPATGRRSFAYADAEDDPTHPECHRRDRHEVGPGSTLPSHSWNGSMTKEPEMSDETQAGPSDLTHKPLARDDDTEGQSQLKPLVDGSEEATHKPLATDDDTEGQSLNHKTLATSDGDDPA